MFAAIDIGTNTVLLLIARYEEGKLEVVHEEQRIPRLGKGVDENRNLSDESVERVIQALKEYRTLIDCEYPAVSDTIVAATSAVRDSANREAFKSTIKEQTGFKVRILSGEEEAEWTYLGARSMLQQSTIAEQVVTLDIGGGSSEVSLGRGYGLIDFHSYDIGSVRFTERFIHSDPPRKAEIEACRKAIAEAFEERPFSWEGNTDAVGVAGTVTSLAYMEAGLNSYDGKKLNGMRMSRESVHRWTQKLSSMRIDELLRQYPIVMEGRADVFLPGILILDEFLKRYDFSDCVVSTGGIRHGGILILNQD